MRRVSDATFEAIADFAAKSARSGDASTFQLIALDLRDERADHQRKIAEIEKLRDEAISFSKVPAASKIDWVARVFALNQALAILKQEPKP